MAASGYSPIQLYYSTTASTAPAAGNLVSGELAINITDGKLYYKDNAGVVQLLSTSTTANGTANGVLYLNGSKVATSGSALTFDGSTFAVNSAASIGANTAKTKFYSDSTYNGIFNGASLGSNESIYMGDGTQFFFAAGSEQMRLTSTGLGIGTSSPTGRLDVNTTAGEVIYSSSDRSTNGQYISGILQRAKNSSSSYVSYAAIYGSITSNTASSESGALTFWTMGSGSVAERARIDSSGNFLVYANTKETRGVTIYGTGANGIYSKCTGTVNYWITNDGLGTGSGTIATIYNDTSVAGSITVSGTTTSYVTSSDYRLKENVQPMTGALAKVAQLKPVTYTWKADGSNGQGFIAHELQAVAPDCVVGEKDAVDEEGNIKPQGIDTSFLVATLTAAIQEQQAQIESLRKRLADAGIA